MGTKRTERGPFDVLPIDRFLRGTFVERPNRFLARCRLSNRKVVEAFLPNPGRLWELLFPGSPVWLTEPSRPPRHSKSQRRTEHTLVAVQRDGCPILLHTHWTNLVARQLLQRQLIPGLQGVEVVRAEVPVGGSRFDFLIREHGREVLVEVKSCTLYGNRVAMFPDAVTARGAKHLRELAELSRPRSRPIVLFVAHTPHVDWFLPDYHTDLEFSRTLCDARRQIRFMPVSVCWDESLRLVGPVKPLTVPWDFLDKYVDDRGSYLLILKLDSPAHFGVGALGTVTLEPGYYVYAGSAQRNLAARLARHQRRHKKKHWHVDYLREQASSCTALAIRAPTRDECRVASQVNKCYPVAVPRFGSSDCRCPSHLFRSETDPLNDRSFHDLLQRFRMQPPLNSATS